MTLRLHKVKRGTVTDSIIDQLLDVIQNGELGPGDRVPGELELAERLGVGRTSVREALKALQILGLIERRPEGTFMSKDARIAVLDRMLQSGFLAKRLDVAHLFQARRIIEGEIGALAATRTDNETLKKLEELCNKMEAIEEDSFEEYFSLDMQFHQQICETTENPVLTRMWNIIHDLLESARTDIRTVSDIKEQSNINHAKLLEAFKARNAAAARETIHESLSFIEESLVHALQKNPPGD